MNAPLKRVAIALGILFLALLVNANVVQVGEAGSLRSNPHNSRILEAEYARQRGEIVVGGQAIAESVKTNDNLKYLRRYPGGPVYAPVTGYYSLYNDTGLERLENGVLAGTNDQLFFRRLTDLFTGHSPQGGTVVLTLNARAQQAAWSALQGKRGAAVAIDPSTGAILALVSTPSFDPNKLSTHDSQADQRYYNRLLKDPGMPLLNRALNQTYPPGSLFKIVTASAALSSGRYTPSSVIPAPTALKLPLTNVFLHNFGGESCGNGHTDTLLNAFQISCNTAFADLGVKLGAAALQRQAEAFGIGHAFDVPLSSVPSVFPDNPDAPQTALSAIGQFDVRLTPLQAAMIAAGIANHGVVMQPYLVAKTLGPDLSTLMQTAPQRFGTAVTPAVAASMTQLMEAVVAHGTGTAAQIPGVTVAGKTGTAQHCVSSNPANCPAPHAWFTAFAPAQQPKVAVAVLVEDGGGLGSDATGGAVAAPIAKKVIEAVLGR